MKLDSSNSYAQLTAQLARFWQLSGQKIKAIDNRLDPVQGAAVFTVQGRYTAQGWTDWTEGFQYGSALLQYEATNDESFLQLGRTRTLERMTSHLSHMGVHDHAFNNVSTYGNLLKLMKTGRIPQNDWEQDYYELALKMSGAVQAARWTSLPGGGYVYSFNGPHSLFIDAIRTVRSLTTAHQLGHSLRGEQEQWINLLHRAVQHLQTTARYAVYYGQGRDMYDVRGRTTHESLFNVISGTYRCPNVQQGYSPYSTWTRGLAWGIVGFAEQLEIMDEFAEAEFEPVGGKAALMSLLREGAEATSAFYEVNTPSDGIPYWDTGAPGLVHLGDYLNRPADPFNAYEPVDSSSAAIAAQGFLRLARYLGKQGETALSQRYEGMGIQLLHTLLDGPYLSTDESHEGLLLHSVYHRPRGWDYLPAGSSVPYGESCMWGDYHLREAVLVAQEIAGLQQAAFS